jgi:hypothetical protein
MLETPILIAIGVLLRNIGVPTFPVICKDC